MWKTPRTLLVAGAALVVGLGVGAAVVPALAAQDPVLTPDQQSQLTQQSEAYRACLQAQGVTRPTKPADGTRPEITDEQRAAMEAARQACDSQRPARPDLTDEQKAKLQAQMDQFRACLSQQGLTLPDKPAAAPSADGTRPERPQITADQIAAMKAAMEACKDLAPNLGVGGPGGFGFGFGGHGPGGPGGFGGAPQGTKPTV